MREQTDYGAPEKEKAERLYKEVIELLRTATDIEQALMAQYLYASFAIKPKYDAMGGQASISEHFDLMGVAIEEMRHLNIVSAVMARLKAPPSLSPVRFPFKHEAYPFEMDLKPLSAETLAQYVYVEARPADISPEKADREFIERLKAKLGNTFQSPAPGSIYIEIIGKLQELRACLPQHLFDRRGEFDDWVRLMEEVRLNGVDDHFCFFKELFTGKSQLISRPDGKNVWDLPETDPDYPSYAVFIPGSGLSNNQAGCGDGALQAHTLLSNLHYWIILGLLNLTYRFDDWEKPDDGKPRHYLDLAQKHMRGPLPRLGAHLASHGIGLAFGPFLEHLHLPEGAPSTTIWDDEQSAKRVIGKMVDEAEGLARKLKIEGSLVNGFNLNIYAVTLSGLVAKSSPGPSSDSDVST